jgi:uncharacterized protein YggE
MDNLRRRKRRVRTRRLATIYSGTVTDDPTGPLLSVRGEARASVAPDCVVLFCTVTVSRTAKAKALRDAASALQRLTADLGALGAVPLTAETEHAALTWSARSATSWLESAPNKTTGIGELTGQVVATVTVLIAARAFESLDALGRALASHKTLHVQQVSWQVDADNPGWAQVRSAAIHAAIAKGRDYAAALGGALRDVQHIADVGLLNGEGSTRDWHAHALARTMYSGGGAPPETPSLDPEPQELTAAIEARFTMAGVSLTGS